MVYAQHITILSLEYFPTVKCSYNHFSFYLQINYLSIITFYYNLYNIIKSTIVLFFLACKNKPFLCHFRLYHRFRETIFWVICLAICGNKKEVWYFNTYYFMSIVIFLTVSFFFVFFFFLQKITFFQNTNLCLYMFY